jgi:hypothetical protein
MTIIELYDNRHTSPRIYRTTGFVSTSFITSGRFIIWMRQFDHRPSFVSLFIIIINQGSAIEPASVWRIIVGGE